MQRTFVSLVALGAITASTAARADSPPVPPPPPAEDSYSYPQVQEMQAPPQLPPAYSTMPAAAPPSGGQWVHTTQYGWLWMPYGQGYTSVTSPSVAYEYVYYPAYGWRWLSAPWVLGFGAAPHWGSLGPHRYAWYGDHSWHRPSVVHVQSGWGRPVAPRWYGRSGHFGGHGRR